jgi:hypothetical protein
MVEKPDRSGCLERTGHRLGRAAGQGGELLGKRRGGSWGTSRLVAILFDQVAEVRPDGLGVQPNPPVAEGGTNRLLDVPDERFRH